MMKRMSMNRPTVLLTPLLLLLITFFIHESALSQDASDEVSVSAEVLQDLDLTTDGAVNFGSISPNIPESADNGTNPVIDPRNAGDDQNISNGETARFLISGGGSQSVIVTCDSNVTLTPDGGGSGLLIFTPDLIGNPGDELTTARLETAVDDPLGSDDDVELSEGGEYTIWVGGQLHRDGELSTDEYSGEFTVTVELDL